MPVGKYDCDYCDKQFQDTPHARKRHLQSSSHLRAKSLWFSKNSNTTTLNSINTDAGGFVKGLCNRFVKTVLLYFKFSWNLWVQFFLYLLWSILGWLDSLMCSLVCILNGGVSLWFWRAFVHMEILASICMLILRPVKVKFLLLWSSI